MQDVVVKAEKRIVDRVQMVVDGSPEKIHKLLKEDYAPMAQKARAAHD